MTRAGSRLLVAASLAVLGCPKPIDPPRELEPTSTGELVDIEAPSTCTYDDECPRGEICDGGECLFAPAPAGDSDACGVAAIEFARDSARLSPNNQLRLADAIECLRELASIELTACAEPHEDPELAARRGASVIGLLTSLGLPGDRLRVAGCPTSSGRRVGLRRAN